MSNAVSVKLKKVLPSVVLLAVIIVLAGLSFLPSVRSGNSIAVAANHELDPEAIRVLGCCRAYASSNDFQTTMSGSIKAKVFGLPYTQKVYGSRKVSGDDFTEVAESVSTFVKAGIRRGCTDGKYTIARGNYKKKSFTYGTPTELDRDGYVNAYGMPAIGIVRYELDNSVIGASKVDDNTFRYVLDVRKATAYSRNEVKTTVGSNSYPEYESVEFTLTTDPSNRAIKITAVEKFRIDKFGGTHCTATYTETFNYD